MRIRTASLEAPVSSLSGGNQQKVLFGREIAAEPKVLLVDEPTSGVDVGARTEIYQRLRALADQGLAVLVSSSDGVELEGLCDRVFIFARGKIVRELTGADVTDTTITEANLTATVSRSAAAAHRSESGLRKLLSGDHFPAIVLAAITAVIMVGTQAGSEFFLTGFNIHQMLTLLSILCFVSMGQLLTILVGGIDLSLGPLVGFCVVLASYLVPEDGELIALIGGSLVVILFCVVFGFLQGLLVTWLRLPSVVVTLASFMGLQGLSLLLRPHPKGSIDDVLSDTFRFSIAGIPLAIILVLVAVRGSGMAALPAPISGARSARRVESGRQPSPGRQQPHHHALLAFTASGALAGVAGLMQAAQIGIGSGTTGVDYTLLSITAVVLGGASVAGGRGSFLATLLGCALVQATTSASSFLKGRHLGSVLGGRCGHADRRRPVQPGASSPAPDRERTSPHRSSLHPPHRVSPTGEPVMRRTLIKGATVISVDPKIGTLPKADILIDGKKIAAVDRDLGNVDANVIDGTDMIVIPGFVDTHRHTWQSLLRGTAADWTLGQYFGGVRGIMGKVYTPEDMYVANYVGALDALDAGITTLYDWSHLNNTPAHADAAVKGLLDAGLRSIYGYGNPIPNGPCQRRRDRLQGHRTGPQDVISRPTMACTAWPSPRAVRNSRRSICRSRNSRRPMKWACASPSIAATGSGVSITPSPSCATTNACSPARSMFTAARPMTTSSRWSPIQAASSRCRRKSK